MNETRSAPLLKAWRRVRESLRDHRERWLLGAAALLLAVTFFNPHVTMQRSLYEHVIVLDVTQSMNVTDEQIDGKPVSRLDFAKHALRQALLQLPCGSKVGWAIFTEYRSFLLMAPVEVCANLSELRATLSHIDGGMAWSGNSEIAKGLHSAIGIAGQLSDGPSLVFITDGQEAPPLNPHYRPAFDDKPGAVPGLLVGVGDLKPSPIPKFDPEGRPLGFWHADEVMQTDPRSKGRGASVNGETLTDDRANDAAPLLGATPGTEHLSALREPYLRLLASEQGMKFLRLDSMDDFMNAITAPSMAKPLTVRADARPWLAVLALVLLLARYLGPLWRRFRASLGFARGASVIGAMTVVTIAGALIPHDAHANDRPFQVARTAVMEDDENVWSFESWVQRFGHVRGLSFEPEYTFDVHTSVQVELARFTDRVGNQTGHEAEIEFKYLVNNIARDGYGWGASAAFNIERTHEEGTVRSAGLKIPVSIAFSTLGLGDGGGFLHLDAGIDKSSGSRRTWSTSVGVEREFFKRTLMFAEYAHEGPLRFGQVGARYWLQRDKLAIDFSVQQKRTDGLHESGFVIGVGWYDL
jgi:mxaL protein